MHCPVCDRDLRVRLKLDAIYQHLAREAQAQPKKPRAPSKKPQAPPATLKKG
jgi:hypothetical protein